MSDKQRLAFALGYGFFFASGATALMYEIIWLRLLGLIFGNTTFALSTVLTGFMAGLGLGSFWVGRAADRWKRPLFVYGLLECGIAVYAGLTVLLVKLGQAIYIGAAHQFDLGMMSFTVLRLVIALLIIFVPTFCMGATLPVLAKYYIRQRERIGSGIALLYGLNTAGAVTGTVLTGFWLLPLLGLKGTLATAVIINLAIGLTAILLGKRMYTPTGAAAPSAPRAEPVVSSAVPSWFLPTGLFASGITAMLYEVSWTRVLGTVLGSSTYAFTLMLATFLLGIALGSAVFERILKRQPATYRAWGLLQATAAISALFVLPLYDDLGILFVRLYALTLGHLGLLQLVTFILCSLMMIVPSFCFGATFPVSLALHQQRTDSLGRGVGKLYLINTCGNILGSLSAGFVCIPLIGLFNTIVLAVCIGAVVGMAAIVLHGRQGMTTLRPLAAVITLLLVGFGISHGGWDKRAITSGVHISPHEWVDSKTHQILAAYRDTTTRFYKEGLTAIVSVGQAEDNVFLKVNGKTDASSGRDMRTQSLSGHLPMMLHPDAKEVLVIGFGSGVTLAATLAHPVEHVDMVEIEQAVIDAAPFFDSVNRGSYKDERAKIYINDGRNHLLIQDKPYDVIVSEPSNPWMAGLSYLFTVEFYDLVDEHLADDGIFCQWMQNYSIAPSDYRMVLASILEVFPYVTIWRTLEADTLILASKEKHILDVGAVRQRFHSSPKVREDLQRFEIYGAGGLLPFFEMSTRDLKRYVADVDVLNRDDKLPLEFNAPKTLYEESTKILREGIRVYREDLHPPLRADRVALDDDPDFYADVALAHIGRNKGDDLAIAKRYLKQALKKQPDHARSLLALGRAEMLAKSPSRALHNLESAAKLEPNNADILAYLGVALAQNNRAKESLPHLLRAIALDSRRWEYYEWAAQVMSELDKRKQAADAYRRAIELNPQNMELQIKYAETLRAIGQHEEGIAVLERLRNELPSEWKIYDALRVAHLEAGEVKRAVAAYKALVRENPYRSDNWGHLARLYHMAGDQEGFEWACAEGRRLELYFDDIIDVVLEEDAKQSISRHPKE